MPTMNTTQEFTDMTDLLNGLRALRGPVYAEVLIGAGCDPIDVQIVKSELIGTLTTKFAADHPAVLYLYTVNGTQYLIGTQEKE